MMTVRFYLDIIIIVDSNTFSPKSIECHKRLRQQHPMSGPVLLFPEKSLLPEGLLIMLIKRNGISGGTNEKASELSL